MRRSSASRASSSGLARRAPGHEIAAAAKLPAEFVESMDDDLGVSGALAVVHDTVRAGNTALDEDDDEAALDAAASVVAMTEILGVNPLAAQWVSRDGRSDAVAESALETLVRSDTARCPPDGPPGKRDFERADEIRDGSPPPASPSRHPVGCAVVARATGGPDDHHTEEGLTMAGNSQRRGAVRKGRQEAHRRLRRPTSPRARGQGANAQGLRARVPRRTQAGIRESRSAVPSRQCLGWLWWLGGGRAAAGRGPSDGPRARARWSTAATRSSRPCAPTCPCRPRVPRQPHRHRRPSA